VGVTGGKDPQCRRCMVWEEDKQNKELLGLYKKLIKIRKEEKTLIYGEYTNLYKQDGVLAFKRTLEDKEIVVISNNSDVSHNIDLGSERLKCDDLILKEEIIIDRYIEVKPNDYKIFKVINRRI